MKIKTQKGNERMDPAKGFLKKGCAYVDLSQDSGHIKVKFLFCGNHHLWSIPHPE